MSRSSLLIFEHTQRSSTQDDAVELDIERRDLDVPQDLRGRSFLDDLR